MSNSLDWSRDDIVRHLQSSSVFRRLDHEILEEVADSAAIEMVPAGLAIMAEGEIGDDAFVIIAGRLDVVVSTEAGATHIVGSLGPGDVVGEMALLTDEPRSATVTARRDSALMRVAAEDFRSIVFARSDVLLDVTRTVMDRLYRSIHDERPDSGTRVVAVIPAGPTGEHREFARSLALAASPRRVDVITLQRVLADLGAEPDGSRVAQYLHRAEDENDLVILIADSNDSEWIERCRRQSDAVLLVGSEDDLRIGTGMATTTGEAASERHLVIVHDQERPHGTGALLSRYLVDRHHHIRRGDVSDVERVARIVLGTSVGVVFSGGGARGFAHLGVLRAMIETGMPIDHVGGSSIGSSAAAGHAMRWDWDHLVASAKRVTYERGSLVDLTFPAVALGRGRRLTSGMREAYGEVEIEDLWTDFFCVSTDLTAGAPRIHTSGPVWRAVRSSVSIPGLLPPMPSDDGHVLVDGGVLDNLPVNTMSDVFGPRRIVAVDVRAATALRGEGLAGDGEFSGWGAVGGILARRSSPDVPRIVETMLAASTVAGHADSINADLLLVPDVSAFGILDFSRAAEIIDVGYRYAVDALEGSDLVA